VLLQSTEIQFNQPRLVTNITLKIKENEGAGEYQHNHRRDSHFEAILNIKQPFDPGFNLRLVCMEKYLLGDIKTF
jgi:hypothetical protein